MTTAELKTKLNATIEHLNTELSGIRTGRATTSLVEEIEVDAYGARMKIRELGTLSTPDAQMILISPWDKSLIKDIDKAIRNANLALNPVPDSQVLKVPVPALTEDRRKEFTKLVTERAEQAKNKLRNVRQDAMKDIDNQFSNKEITEDDKFSAKEEVEKIVKEFTNLVESTAEKKKADLMTV